MLSVNIYNFYRIRVVILQNRSCHTLNAQNHLQTASIVVIIITIMLKKLTIFKQSGSRFNLNTRYFRPAMDRLGGLLKQYRERFRI